MGFSINLKFIWILNHSQKNICNFGNSKGFAFQELPNSGTKLPAVKEEKTKTINLDSILDNKKEKEIITSEQAQDSTLTDSIKPKKELLTSTVTYNAKDYTSFNRKKKELYLYNEAEVYYDDMEIKAGTITINYNKNVVTATGIVDTTGAYIQRPVFKQGQNVVEPDSLKFNTETKKALIYNSRTEQSNVNIQSEVTKKINDSVYYLSRAKATTSKNLDDPEYYWLMRQAKLVPGSKVVTGLTNLFIYDVPTPIGLPFAFFPLTKKRTAGVIFPSYGEDGRRGYNLQNLGYYFPISDYFDLAVLGDYYTNGSYGLRLQSQYKKRYSFNGRFASSNL